MLLMVDEDEKKRQLTRGALAVVESKDHPSVPLTAVVVTVVVVMVVVVVMLGCDGRIVIS